MISLGYSLIEAFEMAIRIKVTPVEFESAESNGYVYGTVRGNRNLCAYVDLGQERTYSERPGDDSKTRYRLFLSCDAFFAETDAQADDGDFKTSALDVTVILYC
jgi:hypothetical protein